MTGSAQTLASFFGTIDFLIPLVLGDLSEAQARTRSRGEQGASIAWMIGHLLHHRNGALRLLGIAQDAQEDAFAERFGSTAATDGAGYPSLTELQSDWNHVAEALRAALSKATEQTLDAAAKGAHDEKSVRDKLAFVAFHEGYHLGVVGALRKSLGLLGPAERVAALGSA